MNRNLIKIVGGLAVAAGIISAPAAAIAGISSKDWGFSQDIARNAVKACDTKADGNGVYAKWWGGGSGEVRNSGGNGTCTLGAQGKALTHHQIWADLSLRPDVHGPKVEAG